MLPVEVVAIAALAPCLIGIAWLILAIRTRREDIPAVMSALAKTLRKQR
jgi:hypothetical protein